MTQHTVMHIDSPFRGRIIGRQNRFVVKIEHRGEERRAWINNTGRLEQFLIPGTVAFCTDRTPPGKTDCRLFAVESGQGGAVIDTMMQMQAFEAAVSLGIIPWLSQYRIRKRNPPLASSLIDYLLQGPGDDILLEVKSAVFQKGTYAMYPDCPTESGRKHIRELTTHTVKGGRSIILFIAALPGMKGFKPNQASDPELHRLLLTASDHGVDLRSMGMAYCPGESTITLYDPDLMVDLDPVL